MPAMQNDHGISDGKVLHQSEDQVELELVIPEGSDFFDGHFPQFKLLPAVGQFEIVTRLARSHFKLKNGITHIRRMKFSSPIFPNSRLLLTMDLDRKKHTVTFSLADFLDRDKLYSSGISSAPGAE